MDEIHLACNDVYRLFKLPRGFISVPQHFVAAGMSDFIMTRRHMYSLHKTHFVQ